MRRLNTGYAYASFRKLRAAFREDGLGPAGAALAPGLLMYSERRGAYVEEIRALIRQNGLERFNGARLSERRRPWESDG